MNKFYDFFSDVALVVGSAVGVGLISGKEAQLFVGNPLNAVVFAVVFCLICSLFREFCRKKSCKSVPQVANACFKRGSGVFKYVLSLCSFVCIVCCIAGVQQCLNSIFYVSRIPLYSVIAAALCTLIMTKGMRALKIANVISVVAAVVLLVVLLFVNDAPENALQAPKAYMPVAYALFTFTMSIAVTCRLGSSASKRQNILRPVVASVALAALMITVCALSDFSKPLPALTGIENPFLKGYAVAVITLASVCSIVACAIPIVDEVNTVVEDKVVSSAAVFGIATALSMFGFDVAMRYGYVFVAIVGAVLILSVLFVTLRHNFFQNRHNRVHNAGERAQRHGAGHNHI